MHEMRYFLNYTWLIDTGILHFCSTFSCLLCVATLWCCTSAVRCIPSLSCIYPSIHFSLSIKCQPMPPCYYSTASNTTLRFPPSLSISMHIANHPMAFWSTLHSQPLLPYSSIHFSLSIKCHPMPPCYYSTAPNTALSIPPSLSISMHLANHPMSTHPPNHCFTLTKTPTHILLHSRTRDSNSVAHDTVATALFLIFVDLCGFFIVYTLVFIDFHWFAVPNPSKTIQNPSKSLPNHSKTS